MTAVYKLAAELWGFPANVARTLDIHNSVIKEISSRYRNVTYIDQQSLLPKNGRIFCDPCHLTEAGCAEFARNILDRLPSALHAAHTRLAPIRPRGWGGTPQSGKPRTAQASA